MAYGADEGGGGERYGREAVTGSEDLKVRDPLRPARALAGTLALVLAACGGGGGGSGAPPAPPDLSGVWAGPWQGSDPALGRVSGTWETTIAQGAASAGGPVLLLGDVDCMHGTMTAAQDASAQVGGTLSRPPCRLNTWSLTALDVDAGSATGAWQQPEAGASGTLTGVRIARLGGPRIRFVSPPAGAAGTIVTVSGDALSPLGTPPLSFAGTGQNQLLSADAVRVIAQVPAGATSGRLVLETAAGLARSPGEFSVQVSAPTPVLTGDAPYLGGWGTAAAVSPNGYKVYAASQAIDRSATGSIAVIRPATREVVLSAAITSGVPRSIAASPDGQWIYVAVAGGGIEVRDGALAGWIATLSASTGSATSINPQGLALSPDGKLLLVSDGAPGGRVSVIDTQARAEIAHMTMAAGVMPLGLAFHPDGRRAYVAAAQAGNGSLVEFDPRTGVVAATMAMGVRPTGIAVTPNGRSVVVSNQGSGTLSLVDVATRSVAHVPTQAGPTGVAISPDGQRIFVACGDAGVVAIHSAETGAETNAALQVAPAPIALAIDPRGMSAYLANSGLAVLTELGGSQSLTVALAGSGIGSVTSSPAGIACGSTCQSRFATAQVVTLSAAAGGGSRFTSWSANCPGGVVELASSTTCVATFDSNTPPPTGAASGGGCFIATAAYGSAMEPDVKVLRDFRDRRLLTNAAGRAFTVLYYRYSPAIADWIRPSAALRIATRAALWPIVAAIRNPVEAAVVALAGVFGLGTIAWRRRHPPSTKAAPT